MNIDESLILNEEYVDEASALAYLLIKDVLIIGNTRYLEGNNNTVCLFVNASDVFAYACADLEPILFKDNDPDSAIISL
jgi:hypothetical protein